MYAHFPLRNAKETEKCIKKKTFFFSHTHTHTSWGKNTLNYSTLFGNAREVCKRETQSGGGEFILFITRWVRDTSISAILKPPLSILYVLPATTLRTQSFRKLWKSDGTFSYILNENAIRTSIPRRRTYDQPIHNK